jgi:predicted nicotinamide N-methyase
MVLMLTVKSFAGTGLCGIACSKLGATTCITDKDYVLPLLWANASLNCDDEVKRGELWAERIEWGQRLPKRLLRQGWDYVLCSDVVGCGDEALFPPLIKTLKQLCSDDTTLLMSYKPRARCASNTLLRYRSIIPSFDTVAMSRGH